MLEKRDGIGLILIWNNILRRIFNINNFNFIEFMNEVSEKTKNKNVHHVGAPRPSNSAVFLAGNLQ